jgi:disulfide bond formation protein DsbB
MKIAVCGLALAVIGTVGSLFLSLGMGLKACPLCFYQRTFMMATAAILAVGLVTDRSRATFLCLLCTPLALAGFGVAAFHEYLVVTGVLECPKAILGLGTAPAQSLAIFAALVLATIAGGCAGGKKLAVGLAVIIGLGMAWASIASSPPLPPRPKAPYDAVKQPLDMCRPPYRGE